MIDANGVVTGVAEGTVAISAFGLKSLGTGTARVTVTSDTEVEGEVVEGEVEGEVEGQAEGEVEGEVVEGETPSTAVFVNKASTASAPDGRSWATAYTTLQEAIDAGRDRDQEVWVAKGVYDEKRSVFPNSDDNLNGCLEMHSGVALYGGFAGTETIRKQRNWALNSTVIDGSKAIHNASGRPAYSPAKGVIVGADDAILDGFVIQGGNAEDLGGGGMYNPDASPVISHCIFRNNSADIGGAMLNDGGAAPVITNCLFYANQASGSGSAIYNMNTATPLIVNCTFTGNLQGQSAVYNINTARPTLTNCIIYGNVGDIGSEQSVIDAGGPIVNQCWLASSADPLFADPAVNDYRLQSGSPCIDHGTDASAAELGGVVDDLDGASRPQGEAYDIGAYEYVAATR